MKRAREGEGEDDSEKKMEIVWQTPANPPQKHDYIFRDGRRHVRPYYFEFISHVKNRWAGKTIVDLFAEEFKGRPYDYYVSAVKCGRIQVDGENVPVSYVVKSSQKISHFLHRHEPPVMALDVSILQKEPDVVTICKPASVPVHPCGQYRKNTVVGILQAEHGLAPLFPVHRLDRLVSGLLILARNASKADLFRQEIEGGLIHKQYVARVIGEFPVDEIVVDANINYNAREGRSTVEVGDSCGETPTKGKASCTKFTRISTNGTHSIVLCEPITGRTHQGQTYNPRQIGPAESLFNDTKPEIGQVRHLNNQKSSQELDRNYIRVHLQYTGHPIANDILYLSENVTNRSTEGVNAVGAARRLANHPISEISYSDKCEDNSKEDFDIDPMCTNCPNLAPKGYDEREEGLWLHCVQYSGPEWMYKCPYPEWAFLS